MERMGYFGDCSMVGGWMNLLYRMREKNDWMMIVGDECD